MACKFHDLPEAVRETVLSSISIEDAEYFLWHRTHPVTMGSNWEYKKGCRCYECRAVKRYENRQYYKTSTSVANAHFLKQRIEESDEAFRRRVAWAETEPENYVG